MPPAPSIFSVPMLAASSFTNALIVSAAIGVACAVLSVIVVLRRWAFIGEGISHAGFGGIGTAWLLSLAIPALGNAGAVYGIAVLFCLAMAISIGFVSRNGPAGERVASDATIGIFLVASLAWGSLALEIYRIHHGGSEDWTRYLFGDIARISQPVMLAGLAVTIGVLAVVIALFKEILAYTFDPMLARVSGVRTTLVHYLLMVMLALVIVIGMRIAGNVLVTALLVLPGATALLLSRHLKTALIFSIAAGLIGSIGGLLLNHHFARSLPAGPMIVLVLFVEFVIAYAAAHLKPRAKTAA